MLKKEISYTDFNGDKQVETMHFNMSKSEWMDFQTEIEGGLSAYINKIIETKDERSMYLFFKDLIRRSYGIKSEDGKKFLKSEEISYMFEHSAAYDALFDELTSDDGTAASEFVNALAPKVEK